MFVLIQNNGNTDGDMASNLIGTYNSYEDAHAAMKSDLETHIANYGWGQGDHELHDMDAYAMDGDFFEHECYAIWVIFDSDNPVGWRSW